MSRKIIRSILDSVINMVLKWECVCPLVGQLKELDLVRPKVAGIKVFAGVSGLFERGFCSNP